MQPDRPIPPLNPKFNDPKVIAQMKRVAGPFVFVVYVGAFSLLAWLISLVTDFGASVEGGYYELLAQILVTLLLAAVIEEVTSSASPLKEFERVDSAAYVRASSLWLATIRAKLGLFALGEACCLYAVGADTSSTFLAVVPLLAAIVAIDQLLSGLRRRAGLPHEGPLAEQLKRARARAEAAPQDAPPSP